MAAQLGACMIPVPRRRRWQCHAAARAPGRRASARLLVAAFDRRPLRLQVLFAFGLGSSRMQIVDFFFSFLAYKASTGKLSIYQIFEVLDDYQSTDFFPYLNIIKHI